MITIVESRPIKQPGLSSLKVSFSYNKTTVDAIKSADVCAKYHEKEKLWEVPCCYLTRLLDALTFIDDIFLTLLKEDRIKTESMYSQPGQPLTEEEVKAFRFSPFAHQIEAINYGLTQHKKWLLLDGCGVGKTLEVIGLAETLKRRGLIEHCLIICGVNSIKTVWENEIKKFSTETCKIVGKYITRTGTVRYKTIPERAEELKAPIDEFFVITNIETLRADAVIKAISKSKNKFDMIAVDEYHRCNNPGSDQGGNLLKLKAEYKIAATGTLITKNAMSAYSGLSWIGVDKGTKTNYESVYCIHGGTSGHQIMGQRNLLMLREEVESCSLRRTLAQVRADIPKLSIFFEPLEMDEPHAKFYQAIREGVKEEADKIELNTTNLLALTTRLRQASVLPGLLTTQDIQSTKINRAVDLAHEIIDEGEKVVIFSTFKEPVYKLAELLNEYSPLINTGDQDDGIIADNVYNFQNNPEAKVFLATGSKMGVSHTLNAAMHLIFLDIPWTWSDFDQQYSRVYRVTNDKPAIIRVLGCADTIDEHVWEIINEKKDTQDYLVDGKPSPSMLNDMKRIILG